MNTELIEVIHSLMFLHIELNYCINVPFFVFISYTFNIEQYRLFSAKRFINIFLQLVDLPALANFARILTCIDRCSYVVESCNNAVKCSFISLLSIYGRYIDRAPYLVEKFIDELQVHGLCL